MQVTGLSLISRLRVAARGRADGDTSAKFHVAVGILRALAQEAIFTRALAPVVNALKSIIAGKKSVAALLSLGAFGFKTRHTTRSDAASKDLPLAAKPRQAPAQEARSSISARNPRGGLADGSSAKLWLANGSRVARLRADGNTRVAKLWALAVGIRRGGGSLAKVAVSTCALAPVGISIAVKSLIAGKKSVATRFSFAASGFTRHTTRMDDASKDLPLAAKPRQAPAQEARSSVSPGNPRGGLADGSSAKFRAFAKLWLFFSWTRPRTPVSYGVIAGVH